MIRLGLRLTLNSGREAAVRLAITAAAVAVGVGMLLITLAGINAVNAQNARYAWLETGAAPSPGPGPGFGPGSGPGVGNAAADPTWWLLTPDQFRGQLIGRVDVAATGPHPPVPPGITALPGPGQFYASPAMSKLLHSTPAAELADRFPGTQIGTIGLSALPAPNSLLIVVGNSPSKLAYIPGAKQIKSISTVAPSSCDGPSCVLIGIDARGIDLILSIATAALLFPVLVFIGTATRLSAARREQRFAAMRLVGATPRQIAVISAVESTVAATIGVAAGFGLFFLLRPALAPIPFTGAPFFLGDLSLSPLDVVLVALGVPVAAAIAARIALRRVSISPLGVTRRVTPQPPRARRLIPLLAGLAELAYFVIVGRPKSTPGQIQAYTTGILVVMAGLIIAGPWLTMVGSRIMARRTSRPATLIAARRLADNPQAGFRAISGLVLALFVTSVAVGVITTINAYGGGNADGAPQRNTLVDRFVNFADGPGTESISSLPNALLGRVRAIQGVQAVTTVHSDPFSTERFGPPPGLASCAELSGTPALGRCPAGAAVVTIIPHVNDTRSTDAGTVWDAAPISVAALQRLPVQSIAVATNGSTAAIERSRTVLQLAFPDMYQPVTIAEDFAQRPGTKLNAQFQRLADVVILASLPIAGCGLAVSVAGGLTDRKRPFSLLRLTGAPIGMLRRVVAVESAAPLLVIAVLSSGIGFLAAGLFVRSQLSETLQPPSAGYYFTVLAGLAASLGIIASTLPLLERITGPETARNE